MLTLRTIKYFKNKNIPKFYYTKMESYFKIENNNKDIFLTPNEGYDTSLIFMHGLGDSALGYRDLFNHSSKPIPNRMRVVLLTAPQASVTVNGNMIMTSWYDIYDFNRSEGSISEDDVIKNAERVKRAIIAEAKNLNGDYSKVFLGGFSQGACMTLHVGLTLKEKLGGLLVLSGLLFPFTAKEITDDYDKKDLNIFIGHGKEDELIPEFLSKQSYKHLFDKKFTNLTYKSYDIGHSIDYEELEDIKTFFNKLI